MGRTTMVVAVGLLMVALCAGTALAANLSGTAAGENRTTAIPFDGERRFR